MTALAPEPATHPGASDEAEMIQHPTDPDAYLPLHPLEFRVLLVLKEGSAHGYRIVKEIEARERKTNSIYPGNLYRRIRDLLGKGLLEEVPGPDDVEVDARRRYFGVTSLGEAVMVAEGRRLEALVREARTLGVIPNS